MSDSIDSDSLINKRRRCIQAFTVGFPTYYLVKNRNVIYKSTEHVRLYYIKEFFARSFLGFLFGIGVSIGIYGAGLINKEEQITTVDGREVEKTSIDYSSIMQKNYNKKHGFLPGKIRD